MFVKIIMKKYFINLSLIVSVFILVASVFAFTPNQVSANEDNNLPGLGGPGGGSGGGGNSTTAPTLSTQAATLIGQYQATLNGNIVTTGGASSYERGFQWGTTTAYGQTTLESGSFSTGSFASILSSLGCGTTYHYRSYATNSEGTGHGNDMTFTTSACPQGGGNWTAQTSVIRNWQSIASSSDGTKLAAVVYGGYIYTSTDSGVTWTARTNVSRNWYSITSSGDGTKLQAVVYQGYIYNSNDSGVTWTVQNNTALKWTSIASDYSGENVVATVYGGYIYKSTNSGAGLQPTSAPTKYWRSVTSSNILMGTAPIKLAAVASNGGYIYTSSDFGVTWVSRTSAGSRNWYSIDSSWDGTKLAAVADGGYIYTSTDSGATWTARMSAGSRSWRSIASSDDGTKLAAVADGGYIYTSTDSGATWTEQTSAGSRSWRSIASSDDGTKLATVVYGGFIYTKSSSPTWTVSTQAASSVATTSATFNGNIISIGGSNSMVRGFNYGKTAYYGASTLENGIFSIGAYTYNISGLICGTTYHYAAYATNATGTGYGNDMTFTTGVCNTGIVSTLTTSTATSITQTTALLGATLSSLGTPATISSRGVCIGLDANPSWGNQYCYSAEGTGLGAYTTTVSNLSSGVSLVPNTTYHYRGYANNAAGTGYSADATFTTLPTVSNTGPTVTTQGATSVSKTFATLNGNINSTGGVNATVRGFNYGVTTNYGTTTTDTGSFSAGAYTKSLSTLTCGTTYHYRSYATNTTGTSTGNDQTFTTTACAGGTPTGGNTGGGLVPTVTTQGATSVSKTFATLNGNINSTGGVNATVRGFNYGVTTNYGTTTTDTGSFSAGAYTKSLSTLTCGTTYHYRSYATNSADTGYGSDTTFITTACAGGVPTGGATGGGVGGSNIIVPTVTTQGATSVALNSATLNGNITSTGGANATIRGFQYGTDTNYGTTTTETGLFSTGSFTKNITGLACGTTYHYVGYATNSVGSALGNDQTFTTVSCPSSVPTLTTGSVQVVNSLTSGAVILNGTIVSTGGGNATVRGFQYGATSSYGSNTVETGSFSAGAFTKNILSKTVLSLPCGLSYHYRSYATNSVGTGYGDDQVFSTAACSGASVPSLGAIKATSITATFATLNSSVISTGGSDVTTRGFQFGFDTNYGKTTTESGTYSTGAFTVDLNPLTCGTTYHYRSYATNSTGTAYSSDQAFATNGC